MIQTPHLSIVGATREASPATPSLGLLDDVVAPKVLAAMRTASERMGALGVRHVLVGALAVGAHGYPRATRDVNFLVGDEAFELHEGEIVTLKPGLPIQVAGVPVDHLSMAQRDRHLAACLGASASGDVQVAPIQVLVYLKLRSPRQKDLADVVELIKAGIDVGTCRAYFAAHAQDLMSRLDQAIQVAASEER